MEAIEEYDANGESSACGSSKGWVAKRRRVTSNDDNVSPPPKTDNNNADRSFYNEIIQGHVNDKIRNSWLRCIRKISLNTDTDTIADTTWNERDRPETTTLSSIQTLTRQLLQVKRRLWPAAERCADVCGTTPSREFMEARRMCNPMEPLGEGRDGGLNRMFMNRSAIKLVNIDAVLDFTLTEFPPGQEEDVFVFADLCSAPGGFSEYLMKKFQTTRQNGSCRGYGMSLVYANEHGDGTRWKLNDNISQQYGEVNINYRIFCGSDGTGDIYRWENVVAFNNSIQDDIKSCRGGIMCQLEQQQQQQKQKVHLVVCDGGFDAQRDSECQEEIAQKLILCEMAAGLFLLQIGGRLVIKMFGFQTQSVRSAMTSLCNYFNEILLLKPITSRPASAERYVVCCGFRGVPVGWDGPTWMNSILLGKLYHTSNNTCQQKDIYAILDEVDGDILDLNLKACFAILSYLERKSASVSGDSSDYADGIDGDDHSQWQLDCPKVNVESFKYAWKLI